VAAVATEVAVAEEGTEAVVAAAEVAAEVLTAEDPRLTPDIKFSAQSGKARPDISAGLFRFELHILKFFLSVNSAREKSLSPSFRFVLF
jgi:hypothetical protein